MSRSTGPITNSEKTGEFLARPTASRSRYRSLLGAGTIEIAWDAVDVEARPDAANASADESGVHPAGSTLSSAA